MPDPPLPVKDRPSVSRRSASDRDSRRGDVRVVRELAGLFGAVGSALFGPVGSARVLLRVPVARLEIPQPPVRGGFEVAPDPRDQPEETREERVTSEQGLAGGGAARLGSARR